MEYLRTATQDPEAYAILTGEDARERDGLELIPSENYVSAAVREAIGSTLTNKYAEGYPGKRYYGGQEFTDAIETLAIERAKKLFGAQYVNVQPLSGAVANLAAYTALMEPGDTILGMNLSHGGHLTHGHPATLPAKLYKFVGYGMKDVSTGEIDYDALAVVAEKFKPKVLLAGFSAYPRTLDWKRLADIAHNVGAVALADISHIAGLIAGGALANPFDHGFDMMTTTTHKTLRGARGGMILVREDVDLAKRIDKAVFPGLQGGPHMQQIAGVAVALNEAQQSSFKDYAVHVIENAQAMADEFLKSGATLITGGTDNHLILMDVAASFGIGGAEAERLLDAAGITVNKNVIADDTRSAQDPSGIRLGTPALTTRGFDAEACREVAKLMLEVLTHRDDETVARVRAHVQELAAAHPIPESFI